jgi:hypothetical protein
MRSARAVAACIGLATTLAACNPAADYRYFREGIGTDLYWDGLPAATQLQEAYFAHICRQAGLPLVTDGDTVFCNYPTIGAQGWGVFVQAGFNDIDLRCDSYLAWLDNKKRSAAPILKQLSAMSAATQAIMNAADAGPKSITLVGIAFGLAADTFLNVNSRLLQEINHSTVQSVVLGNQHDFRSTNLNVVVDNKPAAVYLIRNYLRICMPFSIEMSINNTVTLFQRGGADALREKPLLTRTAPATSTTSAAIRGTTTPRPIIRDVNAPLQRQDASPRGPSGEITDPNIIASVRRALCLSPSGGLDDTARKRLGIYLDSIKQPHSERFLPREMVLLNRLIRNNKTADCRLFS